MLTFIDESGYPRPTDSTKNPILLGVCIHENDIKPITNQIYKLKDSIYGKQDEIKSTKLIREATITKNRTNNKAYVEGMVDIITVRRHIAGGANGILISVYLPSRLCSPGGDRRLLAEWRHAVVALFEEQESCF